MLSIHLQTAIAKNLETANTELEVGVKRTEEAQEVIQVISSLHTTSEDQYAQELKRQELMKEYADQKPESLLARLAQLQDEMIGLNGSLQISQRRFNRAQADVDQIQANIEALKEPEHRLPQPGVAVSSEEAGQVTQQADAIVAYHTERVEHLQKLDQNLDQLVKTGEGLHSDAVVFNEHIFRMRLPAELVADLIKNGDLAEDQVPETFRLESLGKAQAPSADLSTTSLTAASQAKERRGQLAEEIERSQTSIKEVRDQLEHLQQVIALAEQARKWEQELKDLTPEQVATRFQETAQQILTAELTLKEAREAFDKAQKQAVEEREKFDSLTDPLLRSALQESVAEKSDIIKKLYGFAELDLPTELKDEEVETASQAAEPDGGVSIQETEQYQNLLSTHSRILEEREKQRGALKDALISLNQQVEAYRKALHEADQLAQQQYANAVELKKRIGRQQLQGDAIPDDISEALNRDRIDQFEADLAASASQHADVEQQIEMLSKPDENTQKLRAALDETLTAVGKRLDLLKDEELLQQKYQRSRKDFSEAELTSLQQSARRRAETTLDREEAMLSVVPSAAADGISDSIEVLYKELIELETKQANLVEQKQVTERIIDLGEAEKASINTLLPVLQTDVKRLENLEVAAWARIQAQLMPQKAAEILSAYETKTGEHLSPPPTIPEDERVAAITQATESLLERRAEVVAATKWLGLFEGRISISGLDGEIGKYQDQVGAIDAQSAANQRRVYRLTGYPAEALANLTPEEVPKTDADRRRLLQGDIGALRLDRSAQREQAVIDILIRVAVILVVALILAWIVSLIVNRLINRTRASRPTGSEHALLVLSFFKTILRSAIWITAIVMIMSTLGFNIGAILAGLGIGGLAVAMAARETLADVIGGVMIFMERPFVIGDTIKVGAGPAAKVIDMSWRTTELQNSAEYHFNVPNSQVANSTIQNYTRNRPSCDWATVYVSTEYDPEEVIAAANKALKACDSIVQEEGYFGTTTGGAIDLGQQTVMIYWPWFYMEDYHSRVVVQDKVWQLLWKHMHEAGIKLEIKPFDFQEDEQPPVGLAAQGTPGD